MFRNYGSKGTGEKLKSGMVLAIEPMVNEGTEKIILDKDGYTYRTADGKRSAHFEHTILITKRGGNIDEIINIAKTDIRCRFWLCCCFFGNID